MDRKAHGFGYFPRIVHLEGDHCSFPAGDFYTADFTTGPGDDGVAIGHPTHHRVDAMNCPGFLHVPIKRIVDNAFHTGGDVLYEQNSFAAHASQERQRLSIGRWSGANGTARSASEADVVTRHAIHTANGVNACIGIFAVFECSAIGGIQAVINIATIGGKGWFTQILLFIGFFGDLQSIGTAHMIEPDLASS